MKNTKYYMNGNKYSSCEKYKLFENENKFEIEILYYFINQHIGVPIVNSTNEWFCFMFNDNDKETLYKIIKSWQEDGKIKPYGYSDRLMLEKYLDKIK